MQPSPQIPDVDLRLSELQTQIDRLSLTLHQWREQQDHAQPVEQRLAQLTEQCADILNRWRTTDERHADAVAGLEARLSDWGAIETRLQQDSVHRIRELEQSIEHEWQALRQMHEEPIKELRAHAATLGETCVAAANLALRGFERAEARFAALEQDLQGRMNQLSRELQGAIAELRAGRRPALAGEVSPFPLESVMRIHEELRTPAVQGSGGSLPPAEAGESSSERSDTPQPALSPVARQLPEAAAALAERVESLEREVTTGRGEAKAAVDRTEWMRRRSYAAIGGLASLFVAAGAFALWQQQRFEARLSDAAGRAAAAERQAETATNLANQQIAATREEASRQVAEARQAAIQAQITSGVLAAPDLLRFNLTGAEAAPRAYAQVLLSRSRGLVFSASRLPPAPAGKSYQLWLMSNTGPVSAGLLVADQAGRVTLVTDAQANVPRPVTGVAVTLEDSGGAAAPTGTTVLTRAQ